MRIFLIGFMGSGKTYWGRRWAAAMNYDFVDLDELIESSTGKKVLDMFGRDGEAFFREREATELRTLSSKENSIIACGGGTACSHDNMEWMNDHGVTVYLSALPKLLFDNIMKDTGSRPLVKNLNEAEILYFVETKLKEREVFYSQSRYSLSVPDLSDESLPLLMQNHQGS